MSRLSRPVERPWILSPVAAPVRHRGPGRNRTAVAENCPESLVAWGPPLALNLLGMREVVISGSLAELHSDVVAEPRERVMAHCLLGRFGRVECRTAPARRTLSLLASAIDRLLVPEPPPAVTAARRVRITSRASE